jgi:hypothetical protein
MDTRGNQVNKKLPFDSNVDLAPPSLVIRKILDDAAIRTYYQATNELGLMDGHLYWDNSVAKEIDDYIKRLLLADTEVNDLVATDNNATTDIANPPSGLIEERLKDEL